MCRYQEAMGLSGRKLSFFFDGTKLSGKELPADLGMESGDLIEVWGWNATSCLQVLPGFEKSSCPGLTPKGLIGADIELTFN